MGKYIFIAVIAIMSVIFTPTVYAASEKIDTFTTNVVITKDGAAHIDETISYDFGDTSHHGIYRDIPIDYKEGSDTYYISADIKKITNDGKTVHYETSESNGNQRIKIGDPDATISGRHTYTISYTLSPVVYEKEGKLFLNLDVYGGGWLVSADNVNATVSLEGGAALKNIAWFGHGMTSSTSSISVRDVPAYSPVTINAFLPDDYTDNILKPNQHRPLDVGKMLREFGIVAIGVFAVVAGLAIALIRWWVARSKRKLQTVIPEYEPPAGMLPAGIGHLEDDTSDAKEFTATIIDWAVRGGLTIKRTEKSFLGIKSAEYELVKQKTITDLTEGEKVLFDAIFKKEDTVKVSKLSLPTEIINFRKFVKDRLTEKGYYQKTGNIFLRGTLSDVGAKQWAKVDGFKLYLGVTEKDRLAFSDAPDKTPERFNAMLPYAIAFGVEKEWAKQFEGIDVASSASWYSGNLAAFSAASLATDLSSGLGAAVASNSSFSSSGGSAGGGVGGGGGGSW